MITVSKTATLATDASGDQAFALTDLRKVDKVLEVRIDKAGAVGNAHTISGRTVTVRAYRSGTSAGDPLVAWANASESGINVTVIAEGY